MSNMQEKVADYVPLNTRLQTLKTRLDVPEYNEQQQLLFPGDCKELAKDVYKKVCRFITDCETPSLDLCLVDINYKETIPPSKPREELPINLISELQTCCEPGRIACPELIMYSIAPEKPIRRMMLYDSINIGPGILRLGIDFKNRVMCCESDEDFDFVEILPSMQFDYSCDYGTFEISREYFETIELCYKRLEFLRKYHFYLDICNNEVDFTAGFEPVAEKCIACDTSYEISQEVSIENACGKLKLKLKKNVVIDWCTPNVSEEISLELSQECDEPQVYESTTAKEVKCLHGAYLKYTLNEKATVDWCSGEVILEPKLEAECSCEDIIETSRFDVNIPIPGCAGHGMTIGGTGVITNTLKPDGKIDSDVNLNGVSVTGALGIDAGIGVITGVTLYGTELKITGTYLIFTGGILCGVGPDTEHTISINCAALKRKCGFCDSCESDESSSSASCVCWTARQEMANSNITRPTKLIFGFNTADPYELPVDSYTATPTTIGNSILNVHFNWCGEGRPGSRCKVEFDNDPNNFVTFETVEKGCQDPVRPDPSNSPNTGSVSDPNDQWTLSSSS